MERTLKFAVRFAVLTTVVFAAATVFPAFPQQIARSPRISTPETKLAKAAALTDIRSPSSLPFLLVADVHFKFEKQTVDGKYGLSWASPDMYHEVVVFPGFRQDVVVSHDKIYRKRTSDFLPLPVYEWESLMTAPLLWVPPKGARQAITSLPEEWKGQTGIDCIQSSIERVMDMRAPNSTYKRTACFQTAQGYAVSDDIDDHGQRGSYRFSNYVPLGGQVFPEEITYADHEGMNAEMDVKTLKAVQAFAASEFARPRGASAEAWCAKPTFSSPRAEFGINDSLDPGAATLPASPMFLYVHVNPKGLADKVGALQSSNAEAANLWINLAHRATYPIATCGGTPISREMIVIVESR